MTRREKLLNKTMRKLRIFFFFSICFFASFAEDIISLQNGDIVKAIISEITPNEIKYKKASNPKGPTYTIDKKSVTSILFQNGEIEKFNTTAESSQNKVGQQNHDQNAITYAAPANNNDSIIALYNSYTPINEKKKPQNKPTDEGYIYWGITPNSVLSTNEINIEIKRIDCEMDWFQIWSQEWKYTITNKTKSPIYIDLAQVFKTYKGGISDGLTSPWYDNTVYNGSNESGGGASLGLGAVTNALGIGGIVGTVANGVSIGGGKTGSASESKQMERILIIPPMSSRSLPAHCCKYKNEIVCSYGTLNTTFKPKTRKTLNTKKWKIDYYAHDNAPVSISLLVNYATKTDFSDTKMVSFTLFSRAIYGTPCAGQFTEHPKEFYQNVPKHFIWGSFFSYD